MKQTEKDAIDQQQREVAQLTDFNYGHLESGAAVRGEAVAECSVCNGTKCVYGAAFDPPSQCEACYVDGGEAVAGHPAWKRAILYTDTIGGKNTLRDDLWAITGDELRSLLAARISARAADALDSQPTGTDAVDAQRYRYLRDHGDTEGQPCVWFGARWYGGSNGVGFSLDDAIDARRASSQPTVAAQQGSIADDARFLKLLNDIFGDTDLSSDKIRRYTSLIVDAVDECHAPAAPVAPLAPDYAAMERMFIAAATDLGLINEALGLDPNDGGAVPILDAIADLKAALKLLGQQSLGSDWTPDEAFRFMRDTAREALAAPQQEGSEAGNG